MKITSVECYLGQFITMKINTDEGIYGWGEAGLAYGNSFEAAFGQCQDFAKLIIGMDPFDTEKIWEHLHRHTFWGMGGGVVITSGCHRYRLLGYQRQSPRRSRLQAAGRQDQSEAPRIRFSAAVRLERPDPER